MKNVIVCAMMSLWFILGFSVGCGEKKSYTWDNAIDLAKKEFKDSVKEEKPNTIYMQKILIENLERIKAGGDVNEEKWGETALMAASKYGHAETVKLLIESGADLNTKTDAGLTALMSAAMQGQAIIAKLLINKGADVNARTLRGDTALSFASSGGHTETIKILLANKADVNGQTGSDALLLALGGGHIEIAKLLLKNGARPDLGQDKGRATLMSAIGGGHEEAARLLLEMGADGAAGFYITGYNKGGEKTSSHVETALMLASEKGYARLVELLIAKGATVNEVNQKGQTALTLASEKGHSNIVELLKQHGAIK